MDLISISICTATGHPSGSLHLDRVKQVTALNWLAHKCTESVNRPLVLRADIPPPCEQAVVHLPVFVNRLFRCLLSTL